MGTLGFDSYKTSCNRDQWRSQDLKILQANGPASAEGNYFSGLCQHQHEFFCHIKLFHQDFIFSPNNQALERYKIGI